MLPFDLMFGYATACHPNLIFPKTPVNSQAKLPCSQLDGSFLAGGMVTAKCSVNSTWEPLDMSQCTFSSNVQVAAVAVVELMSLVEDSLLNMEVRMV